MTLHLLPVFVVRLGRQPFLRSVVFLFCPDLGKNDLPTRGCPLTYVPPYCLSSVFGQPSASRYRDRYSDDAGDDSDVKGLHVVDQESMEEMSLPGHLYAVVTFCHTQASVSSGPPRHEHMPIIAWCRRASFREINTPSDKPLEDDLHLVLYVLAHLAATLLSRCPRIS